MFAAPSKERSRYGSTQTRDEDVTRPSSKAKKKSHSPEVTLPPLCPEPCFLSAGSVARSLFSRSAVFKSPSSGRQLSLVALPRLVAQVGAETSTKWTEGPRLGTDIPVRITQSMPQSHTEKDESTKVTPCKDKKIMTVKDGKSTNKSPLTGTEVVHVLAQNRDLGDFEIYYLKEVDGDAYRPYDLRVVDSSDAGSEHYIFSSNAVLHVTETSYGRAVSLAEWYREYLLWTALQEIRFFRGFRLRKAFARWHKNVCSIFFQRKCKKLQGTLLMFVPQFRSALHLFTGVIEELKGTHWMPLDDSKTYTLLEFKTVLISKNQECLQILKKLTQYRNIILNLVKEDCYKTHQELQLQLQLAKRQNSCREPIHLLLAHQHKLKKELTRSESSLQKLGKFAALIHQMIVQTLVTVVRQDAVSFLSVLKRRSSQQHCLFHTELCFGANSQLTLEPPIHLFQAAVSEALLTAGNSLVQMCHNCGLFPEISNSSVLGSAQDLTSDFSCIGGSLTTGETKNDVMPGRALRDMELPPEETFQMVQGDMVHGCYYPLSKTQLEWQISINDVTKQVEKEQTRIMQETELEIQKLCERYAWLVDIHLFVGQWSRASLESMRDQRVSLYEEHIKRVRDWAETINAADSSLSTSNQMFVIHLAHTKETLRRQLGLIEEETREHLVEQLKLHSESLRSDLERDTAELKTEPRDLHDLSDYALTVRESVNALADTQKRLEYIHSLRHTVCMNYRKMTEQELTLEQQVMDLWDCFIPLLKRADGLVCRRLPSMANALETMFSFVNCDLQNVVFDATSGPFLNPSQNANEMVSKLSYMCTHVHTLTAKLEQLSKSSENMQENALDLTISTAYVQKVIARKELWELIAVYTTWLEEWKRLPFSEVVVSQAQEKITQWKEQAQCLAHIIPPRDPVLEETLRILESLSHQLQIMVKLQNPTLKEKHHRAIFQDMGLLHAPEKVTVADIMSRQLEIHQKQINKICRDALMECKMEQMFQKLRQEWDDRLFQLDKVSLPVWQYSEPQNGFTERENTTGDTASNVQTACQHSCNDARVTIIDLEIHFSEIGNHLMTLSTILKSPYSVEFRLQLEEWVQSLQELEKQLVLLERYQNMWAFLTKVFGETSFSDRRVDLLQCFQSVDKAFKEMMDSISTDPHVLNFVSKETNDRFHGNSLQQILLDGLSTMEAISNQMAEVHDTICGQYPRLWFLSDREVMQLLSVPPSPLMLQPFVRRCFKPVHWLEVDCEIPSNTSDPKSCEATYESHKQLKVLGVFGSLQEHVAFQSPVEPNPDALVWLCDFEKRLKLTMVRLIKRCAVVQNQSNTDLACDKIDRDVLLYIADRTKYGQSVLDLISEYPLQCLLVAEEAGWCSVVLQAFQESSPVMLRNIKANNSTKLKNLGHFIRDGITGSKSVPLVSKYTMMCLQALVQLTMKQAQQLSRLMGVQCVLDSSFEWLSLMKYHINSENHNLKSSDDPACYVDVLGHRFQYGFEYYGPEDWVMVNTPSTDQAALGILLALASYRCGFVSGPCMSGKKSTVVQLGRALGQQVVVIQCYSNMRLGVVQQMLLGALQTGALLLLDSVDLLTQHVLSLLGQHLVDIHQSFSELRTNKNLGMRLSQTNLVDPECHMVFAGKSVSASPSYGCVLISSKGYASKIPESLRFSTRPVALTRPDYRVIAEVMLTSIGFTEAMPLSHRLVSFISLANDSHCLPGFFTDVQSCFLGVLQKIISASEKHLRQAASSQKMRDQLFQERKETEKHFKFCSSHLSVVQVLMEETAIIKAVLSVLIPEHKEASQFYTIFKDTFPLACQFPFFQQHEEGAENNPLQDAVTEELQQKMFCCDPEIISSALTLYQTMKFSQAVMLVGPPGSGKTTCYSVLAGALNGLAAKALEHVLEHDNTDKKDTPQADLQITTTNWSSVDTVVIFPNAMCHDEIFGYFCEKRGWQDGAVAKVLRDSQRRERTCYETFNRKKKSDEMQIAKWLVMDGEPLGQPGWLDYLTTLCNSRDPFQSLSSGERLQPQTHLKLLMEITDLRDAGPSAVTHCSLVYFTGADLWKAVWKSEIDTLSFKYKLDQRIVKMWNCLAEDLFSRSLDLLGQKTLTSAVHTETESYKSPVHGLQEIMSFVSILHALLQHFGKETEKPEALPQIDKTDLPHGANTQGTYSQSKQELLARNLFLVAYIWGFGGHLHSCHWPQFDLLVRQVLFTCRYKIVVPEEESVFEHFFSVDCKMFPRNPLLTNSIIPKYRKYTYLLNLMLEANQPVLLAGEPGSGKTTLCKTLLSFDKPHVSLPASPLLRPRDLRTILNTISSQRNCKGTMGPMTKQPGLLLFVDDLHEAPCDVFGKMSKALETLRQSISKRQILTFDTHHLKFLSSHSISYMATCCVSGLGNHHSNAVTSRLRRLFTIFVLPSRSLDIILSIHSPWLQMWLQETPLELSSEHMSQCIITATKHLYDAVCDLFQPTMQRPHFVFSYHDLQKVFQGMCLWQSDSNTEPPPSVLNIVHLWMHECMRTFGDRLCSDSGKKTLVSLIAKTVETHYGIKLADETQLERLHHPPAVTHTIHTVPMDKACTHQPVDQSPDTLNLHQEAKPADQSEIKKGYSLTETYPASENIYSQEASLKFHPLQPQMLKQMEDIMAGLVYGPELSESPKTMNKQCSFKCSSSYQGQDLDMLLQELRALVDRKDKGQKADHDSIITTRYMVHRQGVSQLLHVLRALLIPGGHGVLLGSDRGTGRKTTVRLAAYLTGHQLMEVHSGNENKLHEILKEAGNQTREDGVSVTILVHEEISQPVREELLLAMAQRTYPPLHTEDELRNLICRVTAVKSSRRYLMDSWMFEKCLSHVHRNVHVLLLMPFPKSKDTEIPSAQMAKALKLSCCVEVYQPWSRQSLVEVAAQGLEAIHHEKESHQQMTKTSLSAAMAGIHQSACQYASVLLRVQPFSPRTYVEFIAHFGYVYNDLHMQMQIKTNRAATVLSHWEVLNNAAVQYQQNLIRLRTKVGETQQHEKELLVAVGDQKNLLEEVCEKCIEAENKLYHLEEQINHSEKQVKPVFLSSVKILECLNPSDLEEVRHYRDPPDGVVKIMDAICLLFNHPPGWESAKQLLGQSNFFQEMEFFDRYSLTNEQLLQLRQIVHSPHFVPESVREVSKACESLCRWIQAVYECCCMQHHLVVKQQLEVLAKEVKGQLHLAEQHKAEAFRRLEDVTLQLQFVQEDLEEQLLQLHEAESLEQEATSCAELLDMHVRDWTAAAQEADVRNQNAPGDALILAAIISYLGPFGPDARSELLSKWKQLCQTGSINVNPDDPRTSLFTLSDTAPLPPSVGFPIPLTERLQLPLGQVLGMKEWQVEETLSDRLVVKLLLWGYRREWVQRWPLLTDTQQHLEISSQNWLLTGQKEQLEKDVGFEMVVSADDLELLDKLDQAAEKGLRVLVTHVERSVPSPQFLAKLARPTGSCFPGFNQPLQPVHPEFCLFLSTHLPGKLLSSEIHASILARVHVVDLSLSSEEIQELMLTQMLQSECRELLIQHLQFQNYNQLLREKRVTEEDALMDYILQSDTVLLQDSGFLPRVTVCQEALRNLQAELRQLREERAHHDSLLAAPRQLVRLAADLYQALRAVSRLSPSYYFSLHKFISVMMETFIKRGRPLVSYATGKVSGSIILEITNTMVVQLLAQYRPCLFRSHVAVLKLLVSFALLQHNQLCSEAERLAFLRGLEDVVHIVKRFPSSHTVPHSTSALPSWISPQIHSELLCLENIPPFKGLIASLCALSKQWQEYLRFPSSTVVGTVPCRSHSHLSLVQRALLWKTMIPNCLEGLAHAIDSCHICPPVKTTGTEAPHTGNPTALFQSFIKHEGPIILTLPNLNGDERISIQPLHFINQLARCVAATKEVQVKAISFGSLCDKELILPMLDRAVNAGHWLVFNNCHLLDHWDDKVVSHLSHLISNFKEQQCLIHPSFRLWFITQENASCSIPAAVRMCALPLVCDSPWDLKEELSCSLQQLLSVSQPQSWSAVTDDNVELLHRCAIFHSVLMRRQTYKYLGQGRIYYWTQEDLLALVDAHIHIASLCHDKTKALQYIAVNLVHGAHVMDSADLEVVESVAKICFSTMSPLMGSGPRVLSKIISNSRHFDSSRLFQALEQGFMESANVSDPVVLGFSVDVAAEITRINSHNLNMLLQASQTPPGAVRSFSAKLNHPAVLPTYGQARDRLQALKSYLSHKSNSTATSAEPVSPSPVRDLLQAEWDDLIDLVSVLLSQLQQPVQYTATFTSLLSFTDLSRLERRAELLGAYLCHHNISDPPGAYRLSAFRNARGFLVAVMREAAQVNRKYISDITLHFQVLCDSSYSAPLPTDAVYLCGLELKGASWDPELGALRDTRSPQPCSLPLLGVRAQVRNTGAAQDTCKSSYLTDTGNVQAAGASSLPAPQLPIYHCPLYLDEEQESGNWGLADVNIITKVPLRAKLNPVLCSLRRVRLVSTL